MSDDRLRARQRQAAEGTPAARSRFLLERVRNGALSQERLQLAAFLGDPAARLASGHPGCKACDELGYIPGEYLGKAQGQRVPCSLFPGFAHWLSVLEQADEEVIRRAGAAALQHTVRIEQPELAEHLVAWDECPCNRHAQPLLGEAWTPRLRQLTGLLLLDPMEVIRLLPWTASEIAVREAVVEGMVPWLLGEEPRQRVETGPLPPTTLDELLGHEAADPSEVARLRGWAEQALEGIAAREGKRRRSRLVLTSVVLQHALNKICPPVVEYEGPAQLIETVARAGLGEGRTVALLMVRDGEHLSFGLRTQDGPSEPSWWTELDAEPPTDLRPALLAWAREEAADRVRFAVPVVRAYLSDPDGQRELR